MNKFLSRFSTALIGLSLAVGIGVSLSSEKGIIRAEATDGTITLADGSYSSGTITWRSEHLSIKQEQGSSTTKVNSSYVSAPRWYASHIITFTPLAGFSINSVSVTCTSPSYANALGGSTFANADPSVSGSSVTITPKDHTSVFTVTMGTQSRISQIAYSYSLASSDSPVTALSISGSMTKTEYYLGESWDPTGLSVTATYASGATALIDSSEITWTYSPERPAVGATSVVATAKYNGKTASSSNQTVTVLNGILFDFEANFENYSTSGWSNVYTTDHTITSSDLRVNEANATIKITGSSKQGQTLTTMPVVKASTITFTLDASESRAIDHVEVNFAQWTTKTQSINLYKGLDTTATAISTLSFPNSGTSISASGLNSNSFTCITTKTDNQIGIKSIVITLKEASFGTLDHISVSSLPNKTTYCVGEKFASEGLVVTAYDGADELTANSKDVTATASHMLEDGYTFAESDVTDAFVAYVGYTENGVTVSTSYSILVANNSSYSLVTTEPSDWTGEYLVVTNNAGSLLGLNATLDEVDIYSNFVNLTATDNTISTPSFNSIVIEKMDGGYSVKSTYTGKYYGNNIKDNGLSSDTSPILNTISLNSDGTAALVSNTRTLAFNNASNQLRFRYFIAPGAQQSIYLYRKDISTNATNFATMFLDQLTCDPTGVTPPDTEEWAILELEFADLTAYDQTEFKIASANASGNVIEQAVAKYDYIITKYGVTNYVDFMGRVEYGSLTLANNRIEFADKLDSQSTIICVVVLTLLSVSTIGGYIILKKTKEN